MKQLSKITLGAFIVVAGVIMSYSSAHTLSKPTQTKTLIKDIPNPRTLFAQDRILIKLRSGSSAERFLKNGELSESLRKLNKKNKVKEIKPVFIDLVNVLRAEGKTFSEHVEEIKRKFPERTARAPKGVEIPNLTLWQEVIFKEKIDVGVAVREYKSDPGVEDVQPNYRCELYDLFPNDPYFWSTGSWGQDYADLWGLKKINCEGAWSTFASTDDIGAGVVVAVVDSGIDYNHKDLAENIWQNMGEDADGDGHTLEWNPVIEEWVLDPGDYNGSDDDGNGKIDDFIGWDTGNNDNNPYDKRGHGSHCAGIIAAGTNNGRGVAGVSWHSKIMPVKGFPDTAFPSFSYLANGILYAVDNGADVISNSWGPGGPAPYNPMAESAVIYAYRLGAIVVFAAGNSNDDVLFYSPNNMGEVTTVAATDRNALRSKWLWTPDRKMASNYGELIDVSAPGGGDPLWAEEESDEVRDILSTMSDDSDLAHQYPTSQVGFGYYRLAGTSMACPHVAGLAALLLSYHPDWSNDFIKWHIKYTATNIDAWNLGYEGLLGTGRINAEKAFAEPMPPLEPDCNDNGIPDAYDIVGYSKDCNGNGIPDECDIASGYSQDIDENGVPDECHNIIYVDDDCSGSGDGSESDPFCTIQEGIDATSHGDTVMVRDGIYQGTGNKNIQFTRRDILLRSVNGPEASIVDCEGEGRGFYFGLFDTYCNSIVDGLTITNGSADFPGGGAISCRGGWMKPFANPIIRNCIIKENSAMETFYNGGAIYCSNSSPTITSTIITGNSASSRGGGIYCSGPASPTITNTLIVDNYARWLGGGGIYCEATSPQLTNCTIAYNREDGAAGGGIYLRYSSLVMNNSIVWGNSANDPDHIQIFADDTSSPAIGYSAIQGGWDGIGNIEQDPLFMYPLAGDFQLIRSSPCIDAADNTAVPIGVTTDFDGNPRFIDDPDTGDTGNPDPDNPDLPIVDMGAYEYQERVKVTVELSPTITTGRSPDIVTRCLTFELSDGTMPDPVVVTKEITFIVEAGSPTVGIATLAVPFGDYICTTAQDALHTLRRTDDSLGFVNGEYVADFTGEDRLVGGNLNGDDVIDDEDFTILMGQWGTDYGTGDTSHNTPSPHADINGDGKVTLADYTFIQINYGQTSEAGCCGAGMARHREAN